MEALGLMKYGIISTLPEVEERLSIKYLLLHIIAMQFFCRHNQSCLLWQNSW